MDNGGAFTARLLAAADIPKGASALDIGCCSGAVTFRLADAVGSGGMVLGIDTNADALTAARAQADRDDYANVRFAQADLFDHAAAGNRYDIVMCRRVLMYLPDKPANLAAFRTMLKPGGLLLLQEHDASVLHSSAPVPLFDKARSWIWDTVAAEGASPGTGFALHGLLTGAGFSEPHIMAEAIVETPTQASPLAAIVEVMMPRIAAAGVATAAEIGIDTLAHRLAEERRIANAISVGEVMFGAIAHT